MKKKFGRKPSFQDAPRTLDIDIIFFDKKKDKLKKFNYTSQKLGK